MSVRSETPTSFFLVLSKAAFRTWGFPPPLLAACALLVSFLRPARLVTACQSVQLVLFLKVGKSQSDLYTMVVSRRFHDSIALAPATGNGWGSLEEVGNEHWH